MHVHFSAVLSPLEYTAYEGSHNATFECTLTGIDDTFNLVWLVDGRSRSTDALVSRGISLREESINHEILTISATEINKNTTIRCGGVVFSPSEPSSILSEVAVFMVQGKATTS